MVRIVDAAIRLVLVGIFLLLAALGQLSGIDILGETAAILGTDLGRCCSSPWSRSP